MKVNGHNRPEDGPLIAGSGSVVRPQEENRLAAAIALPEGHART
jgi:hypothetical protein